MKFEWDPNKDRINRRKHGLNFAEALSVFFDEFGIVIHDPEHSDDEDRFLLLGMSSHLKTLVVCFCEREGDAIRIISARKANKKEKITYWDGR